MAMGIYCRQEIANKCTDCKNQFITLQNQQENPDYGSESDEEDLTEQDLKDSIMQIITAFSSEDQSSLLHKKIFLTYLQSDPIDWNRIFKYAICFDQNNKIFNIVAFLYQHKRLLNIDLNKVENGKSIIDFIIDKKNINVIGYLVSQDGMDPKLISQDLKLAITNRYYQLASVLANILECAKQHARHFLDSEYNEQALIYVQLVKDLHLQYKEVLENVMHCIFALNKTTSNSAEINEYKQLQTAFLQDNQTFYNLEKQIHDKCEKFKKSIKSNLKKSLKKLAEYSSTEKRLDEELISPSVLTKQYIPYQSPIIAKFGSFQENGKSSAYQQKSSLELINTCSEPQISAFTSNFVNTAINDQEIVSNFGLAAKKEEEKKEEIVEIEEVKVMAEENKENTKATNPLLVCPTTMFNRGYHLSMANKQLNAKKAQVQQVKSLRSQITNLNFTMQGLQSPWSKKSIEEFRGALAELEQIKQEVESLSLNPKENVVKNLVLKYSRVELANIKVRNTANGFALTDHTEKVQYNAHRVHYPKEGVDPAFISDLSKSIHNKINMLQLELQQKEIAVESAATTASHLKKPKKKNKNHRKKF